MGKQEGKFTWADKDFDDWCKREAEKLKCLGISASTAGITRLLHKRVLLPNNINMSDLIKEELKIKRRIKRI